MPLAFEWGAYMDKDEALERKVETLRLLYRNKGITKLSDDQLKNIAWQQDFRMSILGDVVRILLIAGSVVFLVWRFWPR
jgi:hypothetical protein